MATDDIFAELDAIEERKAQDAKEGWDALVESYESDVEHVRDLYVKYFQEAN